MIARWGRLNRLFFVLLGFGVACSDSGPVTTQYQLFASVLPEQDGGADACGIFATLRAVRPLPDSVDARVALEFQRVLRRNGMSITKDTVLPDQLIHLRLQGGQLQVQLPPPLADTLIGTAGQGIADYGGPWVCGPDLPFADDSSVDHAGGWGLIALHSID